MIYIEIAAKRISWGRFRQVIVDPRQMGADGIICELRIAVATVDGVVAEAMASGKFSATIPTWDASAPHASKATRATAARSAATSH